MLPSEPKVTATGLVKFKPQAKLPPAAVLQLLPPSSVKILKRLLTEPAEYVPAELFDLPEAESLLLRPLHELGSWAGSGDDSGVFALRLPESEPVWGLDREQFLFLRMNYCRRQIFRILQAQAGRRLTAETVAELLRWHRLAAETRDEIVRENLPLVLAMSKRTRITGVDITDLISEGNLALLRAVNKFDCSRGYKFSTYACRAILKSFSRVATRTGRYRNHFPTEFDPTMEKSDQVERVRANAEQDCLSELKSILADNSARLSEVERTVVLARFALDPATGSPLERAKTLEQVGEMIGLTKERVRQIQNKALVKLRAALEEAILTR